MPLPGMEATKDGSIHHGRHEGAYRLSRVRPEMAERWAASGLLHWGTIMLLRQNSKSVSPACQGATGAACLWMLR